MSAALDPEQTGLRPFPQAVHIPLDLIDPNPDQPRRVFDGIPELAAHIKLHGLLQPVIVSHGANGRYTLVAGHRRLAALKWLARNDTYPDRWYDIPAVVRTVELADRLPLAENLARHNLSDADLAAAIQLLVELHGWSQSEIARRLGVTSQWIGQNVLVLADAELGPLVQTGQLSVSLANEVRLAHTAESRQAALRAALQGASVRTVRSLAAGAGDDTAATDGSGDNDRPLPCESDFQVAAEDGGAPVPLRSLAVVGFLRQARRDRLSVVGARALQTVLKEDLRAVEEALHAAHAAA